MLGIAADKLAHCGKYKAKIAPADIFALPEKHGKLILVTAINPTPTGEGKTTVTIGLADAAAESPSFPHTHHCRKIGAFFLFNHKPKEAPCTRANGFACLP